MASHHGRQKLRGDVITVRQLRPCDLPVDDVTWPGSDITVVRKGLHGSPLGNRGELVLMVGGLGDWGRGVRVEATS